MRLSLNLAQVIMLALLSTGGPTQSSFSRLVPQTKISYVIHIKPDDLSGFAVEMRVYSSTSTLQIAMASHPEYDDRYWRYVENLTAESKGTTLTVTQREDALWQI